MLSKVARSLNSVGAIGDIHAEDLQLERALEFLATKGVDGLLAVGDVVDGPGDVLRCCQLLHDAGVETVAGNHDRWRLESAARATLGSEKERRQLQAFLEKLPTTRSYDSQNGRVLLCHGMGENDMNGVTQDDYGYGLENNDELQALLRDQEYRFVICGHTHRRMVREFGGLTVINVGTLFRENDACFAWIHFSDRCVVFYDIDEAGQISEGSRHRL